MADILDKRPWPLRHRIQCDITRVFFPAFLFPLLRLAFWSVTFLRGGFSFFSLWAIGLWCVSRGFAFLLVSGTGRCGVVECVGLVAVRDDAVLG
ncbi:hypothetical protein V8C34DRAFT_284644 [Trichoderma compactum]